jgi:hypothetical protein
MHSIMRLASSRVSALAIAAIDYAATLVCMVTRFFLSMLTICGVHLIESARNFV